MFERKKKIPIDGPKDYIAILNEKQVATTSDGMSCVGGQGQVCIEIMESCKIVYRFKNCLFF